jgi:integral membrane sensor domain MASE1
MKITVKEAKIEDWIAYQLTGAMISCLTAAISAVNGVGENCLLSEARFIPCASHGVDRLMFE